jgi:hypothetical protein
MKRTTILLPDDLAYLLDRERRRRGVSTAAIVREAVAAYFNITAEPRHIPFAALGDSGLTDIGENFEAYLEREWGSEEFFERAMGRARTPEERAAAQKHHAIWKPEIEDVDSAPDAHIQESELDEARVGD